MRRTLLSAMGLTGLLATLTFASATVGQPAPAFSGMASDGKTYNLADYKGKYVVLEWYNKDCPFIHKHYDSGNMQKLQAKYGAKGVIWFEVASSAQGHEGYMTPSEAQDNRTKSGTKADATILDSDGKIGMAYGAKTTPHMFVIDPKGILIYQGAIDSKNSADQDDIASAKNYVATALDEAMAGKPVSTPSTHPYGCGVKYN